MKKIIQTAFLFYIRILAILQLKKFNPIIVGVTGSEGKSSTVAAITQVLSTKYKVKRTGKANSETGIPLDILGLEVKEYSLLNWVKLAVLSLWKLLTNWKNYEVYVAEMAIDSPFEPKNMTYLLKIMQPKVAVMTSISPVHAEYYIPLLPDEEITEEQKIEALQYEITKEKGKLIKAAIENGGFAIANIDNQFIETYVIEEKLDIHTVTKDDIDNYRLLQIKSVTNSAEGFQVVYRLGNQELTLNIKEAILGEEFAYTFGYAIQAGLVLDVEPQAAISALSNYKAPKGRFRVFEGIRNSKLIDSTYNSSPVSLENALELLKNIEWQGRKIAVLGDMRELGEIETEEHAKLARIAAKLNFDEYLLVGKNMNSIFKDELILEGIDKNKVHTFKHALELGEYLKENIQENDLILFKGSQNTIFLEEALKMVLNNSALKPTESSHLLCRQSEWWLETKMKYFKSVK